MKLLQCITDSTLYYLKRENEFVVFLVYDGDKLLLSNSDPANTFLIKSISSLFEIRVSKNLIDSWGCKSMSMVLVFPYTAP